MASGFSRKAGIQTWIAVWLADDSGRIKALPIGRKIQIMEVIWEDFRDRFDRLEVTDQQKDLLDRRRARVREGTAQLLDWESVKGTIGRR